MSYHSSDNMITLFVIFTGGRSHLFQLLKDIKANKIHRFKNILKTASTKITKICKLDKEAWKALDVGEVECKDKVRIIEQARDEQV